MNALEKFVQEKSEGLGDVLVDTDLVEDLLREASGQWLEKVVYALKQGAHPTYGIHDFADTDIMVRRLEEDGHLS